MNLKPACVKAYRNINSYAMSFALTQYCVFSLKIHNPDAYIHIAYIYKVHNKFIIQLFCKPGMKQPNKQIRKTITH